MSKAARLRSFLIELNQIGEVCSKGRSIATYPSIKREGLLHARHFGNGGAGLSRLRRMHGSPTLPRKRRFLRRSIANAQVRDGAF
jgi:hypothetical protein